MGQICFGSTDTKALARLAIVTIGGVLGIHAVIIAGRTAIQGTLARPGDLGTAALVVYALALGGWCGWTGRTSNSTVVVSLSFVFALGILAVIFAFVEGLGAPHGTNWRFLALLLVMLLGAVQAISLVGYWIGKFLPN
jgi:hypothetical protein